MAIGQVHLLYGLLPVLPASYYHLTFLMVHNGHPPVDLLVIGTLISPQVYCAHQTYGRAKDATILDKKSRST